MQASALTILVAVVSCGGGAPGGPTIRGANEPKPPDPEPLGTAHFPGLYWGMTESALVATGMMKEFTTYHLGRQATVYLDFRGHGLSAIFVAFDEPYVDLKRCLAAIPVMGEELSKEIKLAAERPDDHDQHSATWQVEDGTIELGCLEHGVDDIARRATMWMRYATTEPTRDETAG